MDYHPYKAMGKWPSMSVVESRQRWSEDLAAACQQHGRRNEDIIKWQHVALIESLFAAGNPRGCHSLVCTATCRYFFISSVLPQLSIECTDSSSCILNHNVKYVNTEVFTPHLLGCFVYKFALLIAFLSLQML